MEHTDYSAAGARIAEYNRTVKKKPDHLKYKTENIPSVPRTCIICGKEYLATPAAIKKRGGGVVCSSRCGGIRAAHLTPKRDTSIERAIAAAMRERGWIFRAQVPLCGVTLADFLLPAYRIAIYCDGGYWHSTDKRKAQDAHQNAVLAANGFTVYRFTEADINRSPQECLDRVRLPSKPLLRQSSLPIA